MLKSDRQSKSGAIQKDHTCHIIMRNEDRIQDVSVAVTFLSRIT